MESEGRGGHHAYLAARDVGEQHGAGRLARADDADLGVASGYPAPPRVVLVDAPPVVIDHIDNFGQRRRGHEHDCHHSR